jgi:hypothetical protein
MLISLLLNPLLSSSILTDAPWFKILDPKSPEYLAQLYCGTVARGKLTIDLKEWPVDAVGFAQGIEEIIRYSQANPGSGINVAVTRGLGKRSGDCYMGSERYRIAQGAA